MGQGSAGAREEKPVPFEYKLWHDFQSHEAEFDYLKSLEIEEKINCLRWCDFFLSLSLFRIVRVCVCVCARARVCDMLYSL